MTADPARRPAQGSPLAAQLAGALALLERHCRTNAVGPPAELRALVAGLTVHGGHEWPTRDVLAAPSDAARVPLLVTYDDAAEALSVSVRTVRRLVADGTIPVRQVGRARRIRRTDLAAFAAGANPQGER